jgi:hypothetical protein
MKDLASKIMLSSLTLLELNDFKLKCLRFNVNFEFKNIKKTLRENDLSSNFSPSNVQNHRRLSPKKTNTNVKDYLKQNPFLIHSFHILEQKH